MQYHFYEPFTFDVRKSLKRAFKERGVKKQTWPFQKLYLDIATGADAQSPKDRNISAYMLALEHAWFKNSPLCLIPESDKLIDQILRSNFEGQLSAFNPQYKMFSIAIPEKTAFNGQHPRGLFVSISTAVERQAYITSFKKDFEITNPISLPENNGTVLLINYKTGNDLVLDTFSVEVEQIPQKLMELNITNRTQFEILLFVLGLMIYMSAFDGVVEDAKFITMPGSGMKQKIRHAKVRNASSDTRQAARFHFRNLRNPCFYRGDFADLEPGSRWIPVKGAVKLVKQI